MDSNCLIDHLLRLSCVVLLLSSSAAQAEQLSLSVAGQEEILSMDEQGNPVIHYGDLSSVVPGDVVRYTIDYQNHGQQPADSVVITNPVPEQMHYLNGSATSQASATITFSIDGGKSFAAPDQLTVKLAENKTRPAISEDYTHIQWLILTPVSSQERGTVGYKAKLK